MVKGVNKQMIVMKLENNRLYEQACFILKNEFDMGKSNQTDMLTEANKILEQMNLSKNFKKKKHKGIKIILALLLFLVGAGLGFALSFYIR